MQRQIAEETITLVISAIRTSDSYERTSYDWIFERHIFSHLNVCRENISKYFNGSDSIKAAAASSAIGSAYKELGCYEQAEALYQRSLTGREKAFGKDHYPYTFNTYQRSLAGKVKSLGKDHPYTLNTINCTPSIFEKLGRHDEALQFKQLYKSP
ncbi:hypothetical protein RUND412_010093, partial [Rhizina undulata]